jgi:hypothetical protein
MLRDAGFVDIEEHDWTNDFVRVARAWIAQWDEHRVELTDALGDVEFEDRQTERRIQLRAVEDGLLRRSLYVATRR